MDAIKINLTVESDTLKIPELNRFIGKEVEIILLDNSKKSIDSKAKFNKIKSLQGKLNFDDTALDRLRNSSIL